jgi:hypothetical protein
VPIWGAVAVPDAGLPALTAAEQMRDTIERVRR